MRNCENCGLASRKHAPDDSPDPSKITFVALFVLIGQINKNDKKIRNFQIFQSSIVRSNIFEIF